MTIYGIVFIYFSIIHVPFKTEDRFEIDYDTLFSNRSKLDVSRLILIMLLISIIAAVILFLFWNLKFTQKTKVPKEKTSATKRTLSFIDKKVVKIILILLVVIAITFLVEMILERLKAPVVVNVKPLADTTTVAASPPKDSVGNNP